jgi:transaldolase
MSMEAGGGMDALSALGVKIFADGADVAAIAKLASRPWIRGVTTNPTLMRKAQVADYREFALAVLDVVRDKPVCFEVFSDDLYEMEEQALEIASWGANVYVKVPVTNTGGVFCGPVIGRLARAGVRVNVTAMMSLGQVERVVPCLDLEVPAFVSVFAGRVADTGRDPMPLMEEALRMLEARPRAELIWASPRELLNIFQADRIGCHIITVTPDILAKLPAVGRDLDDFSLDTVKMFRDDAVKAGYEIRTGRASAV